MSDAADEAGLAGSGSRRRRRSWTLEEKLRMVAESREPGVSVSVVARRYDVNANQLFSWRGQFPDQDGGAAAGAFVPVVVSPETLVQLQHEQAAETAVDRAAPVPDHDPEPTAARGRMEIVLAKGVRVIVDPTVNAAALARVIAMLGRR